jgi:1-acyl-sn-glycerol-3-phosphate acyltransferase
MHQTVCFLLDILRRIHGYVALAIGFATLILGCLVWSVLALMVGIFLKGRIRVRLGRQAASFGFRAYLALLHGIGCCRFELQELDALRNAGPLIIAPNHPSLLDALLVISRLPDLACVLKASLLDNILWGAGARLAGYIRNDWFIGSIKLAVSELRQGSQLLLFPEGTRTQAAPTPNAFRGGLAFVAQRAQIPVQTVFIEQDTDFLGKGWSFTKRPSMPVHFRVRLGKRFPPPENADLFTQELCAYFTEHLHTQQADRHNRAC